MPRAFRLNSSTAGQQWKSVEQLVRPDVFLDCRDQRDSGGHEEIDHGAVGFPVVGPQIVHFLTSALNSLRHELGLLFGGVQIGERAAFPFALHVEREDEALSAGGGELIDRHHG
jgi:hypothetical protein